MTTIKDIAKIAKVSMTTVSKVINKKTFDISEATVKRIEKILEEENYIPNIAARSMRTKRSYTLGLIIPDIRNPFFTEMARGAEDEAYKHDYNLVLANSDDVFKKEIEHIKSMVEKQVDGILIAGSVERDSDIEIGYGLKIPTIAIDRPVSYPLLISTVTTENTDGAYKAVDYLVKQGHKKILHIAGPKTNEVSISRLNGYIKALKDNDVDFNEEDVCFGNFTTSSGYDRVMDIKDIEKYTAIFCSNDIIALGVLSALNNRDIKVPQQISLMGVDDIEYAALAYPSLTTIDQSAYDLGRVSACEMIKYLKGKKIDKEKKLKQSLVVRKSVKKLN